MNEQICEVLQHSEAYSYPELQGVQFDACSIVEKWYSQKEKFIKQWGGLIYECDKITINLDDETKSNKIFEFAEKIQNRYLNNDLSDFIFANKDNFFDNLTTKDYTIFDYNKSQYITINAGSKIIKSFKYFETDEDKLRQMQDEASMLIQQDKITGTLCFSVHPLDFLSISENTYNWRSCHALDGDYRAGNLSYMLDDTTFICYIKGEEDQKLPRFPEHIKWNSKKWRILLYLNSQNEVLFAGRQYPFNTLEGLKYIKHYLTTKSLIPSATNFMFGKWSGWHNDQISGDFYYKNNDYAFLPRYVIIKNHLHNINDIIEDESELHFNDLLFSNKYTKPYYLFWDSRYHLEKFKIGSKVPCLICGQRNLDSSHFLECYKCREEYGLEDE